MTKTISLSQKAITQLKTPQIIKIGLFLTWGGCILTLMATIAAIDAQKKAIKAVGEDTTPSILLAQRLKDGMAGMDAFVVKGLLVPPNQGQNFAGGVKERYERTTERLVAAAKNITYGEKEQKPIETLQVWFGRYLAKVQRSQDFHELGNTKEMLIAYRQALDILDQKLFPAADDLDRVNLSALEETYDQETSSALGSIFLIIISGLILIGTLVGLQLFLSYRMRRTFNPLLMLATGISFAFLGYAFVEFNFAKDNLKRAKEDAFSSMYSLRTARYTTYSANAAQGRYLLDTALAGQYEHYFQEKIAQIAKLPPGTTYEKLVAQITANSSDKTVIPEFTGFIANEFANITFDGEKAAALKMLSALGEYMAIDQKIRLLERSGQHQQAIALYIGDNSRESTWAFDKYRKANGDTFDINYAAFTTAIQQGYEDVGAIREAYNYQQKTQQGYENPQAAKKASDEQQGALSWYANVVNFTTIASVVLVLIALLTLFGLTPRMKEYS
jgi:hypothetical protein